MKRTLLLLVLPFALCCAQKKEEVRQTPPAVPVATEASMLSRYDLASKSAATHKLPKKVREASGLAVNAEGALFAHDDERGVVYQIDYTSGNIIKQFGLGRFGVRGDFEGLAVKGNMLYMVRSDGVIYEFPEADDGQNVEYKTHTTFLGSKNDVEGLEYDPGTDCLLLACKESPGKGYNGFRAVYAFSLPKKELQVKPRFLIPLKDVERNADGKQFRPSGIARHPQSGTFFIIAAHGSSIIELSADGRLLAQQHINKKVNPHPEGIAFAPDLTLILCNDGQGESGSILLYPLK